MSSYPSKARISEPIYWFFKALSEYKLSRIDAYFADLSLNSGDSGFVKFEVNMSPLLIVKEPSYSCLSSEVDDKFKVRNLEWNEYNLNNVLA